MFPLSPMRGKEKGRTTLSCTSSINLQSLTEKLYETLFLLYQEPQTQHNLSFWLCSLHSGWMSFEQLPFISYRFRFFVWHVLKVEEVFHSKTRMKILKVLFKLGQLNISEIARRVGANYVKTKGHLMVLEEEEILQCRMYGRTQLYRFNRLSPKGQAVQKLIEAWNH